MPAVKSGLLQTLSTLLQRRDQKSVRRRLSVNERGSIDFSSNDFLSLSSSALLRQAFEKELQRTAHLALGSGGSRLLDGNTRYAEELERDLAAFHNAAAGLLFNSGFDANTGFFASVPQPEDVIVYDEFIHASVHEGMRLSRSRDRRAFRHNSAIDFESVLGTLVAQDASVTDGSKNVFVAVEAVYSMDGDVAPLSAMLDIMDAYLPLGNGHMIVDEAHSTGVYGSCGRGLVCALGVEHRVFARLHTFGKALSANGAILLCDPVLRDYLINYARSLIYTTAMSTPSLALVKAVYGLMQAGDTRKLQDDVWSITNYTHARLHAILQPILDNADQAVLTLPHEIPRSCIISVQTPEPRSLAQHCQSNGLIVRPIVPPTVAVGTERIRICLHSGNTRTEVDELTAAIAVWIRERCESDQGPTELSRYHSKI